MALGPFDGRTKRTRCAACSSSHLKCNGNQPCNHCQRRNITCAYQSAKAIIKLDQSKVQTLTIISNKRATSTSKQGRSTPALQLIQPSADSTIRYLYYFDIFVQRNSFVANASSYDVDVKRLFGTESCDFLMHAVTALGALQSSRLQAVTRHEDTYMAMQAYSASLIALREVMARSHAPSQLHVLWTTLLLGLFELMNNNTGQGWLMHMVHGTANALQASGPMACRSGFGRSFFVQARMFETSRALLLNEQTFLSGPEWHDLTQSFECDGESPTLALDRLLNIIVQCSKLRVRTGQIIESLANPDLDHPCGPAIDLAMEGFRLRLALESWRASNPAVLHTHGPLNKPNDSETIILSNIFFAAISIYLSGNFDYEILHWQRWGIAVPTLSEEQIQEHLQEILSLTEHALNHTNISPLLFLFSLRIAGARSYAAWQKGRVLQLLARITEAFAVADLFQLELGHVWEAREEQSALLEANVTA